MAYRLGDNTAKRAGRLTLNPIRHIDPMGLLMMVVFRFGWARPVPVDMRNFKNPKRGMALTALAGPVSNLLLAAVALLLYGLLFIPLRRMGGAGEFIGQFLTITAYLNTALAVFNILPIPPLDGSKVLGAALSDRAYWSLMRFERYVESPYRGMYITLARWCNQPAFFKKKSLREFVEANGAGSITGEYFSGFEKAFPEAASFSELRFGEV